MKKLVRVAAISVMALSLTTGVAAAHSGTIEETGPGSYNKVSFESRNRTRVRNNNNVGVGNLNLQFAESDDAEVKHNTTGGDATSGDATNDNVTTTGVEIDNSGSSAVAAGSNGGGSHTARIENTGPHSYNKVEVKESRKVSVKNNNNVGVVNLNVQSAKTGDADVKGNTTGGDATSGDATNVNDTMTTIKITN